MSSIEFHHLKGETSLVMRYVQKYDVHYNVACFELTWFEFGQSNCILWFEEWIENHWLRDRSWFQNFDLHMIFFCPALFNLMYANVVVIVY